VSRCGTCLQETKLECISDFDVIQLLGAGFNYCFLPAVQTCGGILVAWHVNSWITSNPSSRQFSMSVKLKQLHEDNE
jgi:hypothetical protein